MPRQVIATRRQVLAYGGGGLATLLVPHLARAAQPQVIEMHGSPRGERVWFSPIGLAVAPGATLRFVNADKGNSHTSTAYHPDMFDRPPRIPADALPWNSDLLMPGETFEVTLHRPGVYDYYCVPHEMAGMVGRIVVGKPDADSWESAASGSGDLPDTALAAFPAVEAILASGRIEVEHAR